MLVETGPASVEIAPTWVKTEPRLADVGPTSVEITSNLLEQWPDLAEVCVGALVLEQSFPRSNPSIGMGEHMFALGGIP